MLLEAIWTNEITNQFVHLDEPISRIEKFLDLLDYCDENTLYKYIDEEKIYSDDKFCQWLYEKNIPELTDLKRELQIKIGKSIGVESIKYCELIDENKITSLKFNFDESKKNYLYTIKKMYIIRQRILRTESKADFKEDINNCFQNIFFDDSVKTSINTLNRKFDDIKDEIIDHLIALDEQAATLKMLQKRANDEIAATLIEKTGIDCSPQSGRDSVIELKRTFLNEVNLKEEEICCELHTKFKKFGIDRTKQDRIYFFPGRDGIKDGKIIVVHIGKHL